jgi:hypothetical protein
LFPYHFRRQFAATGSRKFVRQCTQAFFGTARAVIGFPPDETTKRVWNRRRITMSDPRYTDPRLSDPVLRRDASVGGPWSWVAGIAVLALIAFLVIIGANTKSNTASNNTAPATGSAMQHTIPPATTGSGAASPKPLTPAPIPNKSGTQ